MPVLRSCFRPVTPLVIICFLLTGCYHKTLERGAFDPTDSDEYFVDIHLVNDQRINGLLIAETDAYITLSVKDLPDEIKHEQSISLAVSEKQVTLYKKNGKAVSGRIISIEDGLVEIKRADLRYGLKRLKHTFVEQDDIETVLPMGRPGEAQMTFLYDDIQFIKIKGPRVGEKETAGVLTIVGAVLVIGVILLARSFGKAFSSLGY